MHARSNHGHLLLLSLRPDKSEGPKWNDIDLKANIVFLFRVVTHLILSMYSLVFWLPMLDGEMCSLKSGPKYSK